MYNLVSKVYVRYCHHCIHGRLWLFTFQSFSPTNGDKLGRNVTRMVLYIICDCCFIWKFKMVARPIMLYD